jgi:hypothetical protein
MQITQKVFNTVRLRIFRGDFGYVETRYIALATSGDTNFLNREAITVYITRK